MSRIIYINWGLQMWVIICEGVMSLWLHHVVFLCISVLTYFLSNYGSEFRIRECNMTVIQSKTCYTYSNVNGKTSDIEVKQKKKNVLVRLKINCTCTSHTSYLS